MQFTFAELLRSFRQRASLNQAGLATALRLHRNTVSAWERGQYRPKERELVLRLAEELALNPAETDQLLRAADFPTVANTPDPLAARHQLRAPIADFVGRTAEIAHLRAALELALVDGRSAIISGLRGMGGIGKTELAYCVAHDLRRSFPDAQIVLDLRGAGAAPLSAEQALQAVIHAFTPEAKLPVELNPLQRLYCALLHDKRALILADDARDAQQVRALIPPSGSALLVTSRQRFMLPGMISIDLEQLSLDEAVSMVRRICPRLSADEAAAIARACGYLPLALRVSGGLVHNDPALSVADYLAQLADTQQRLARLRDPYDAQLDVAASLLLSYDQLEATAQRTFRHLGMLASDFDAALAQAVADDAADVLRQLLWRNMAQFDAARARWRLHDLVRALALRLLQERPAELEAAAWRYADAAVAIAAQTSAQYQAGGDGVPPALARFDAERPHIDAARAWAERHTGAPRGDRLLLEYAAATAAIGLLRFDALRERIPLWESVCAAAQRLGDHGAEAKALNELGIASIHLGDTRRAIPYFEQRLELDRVLGDQRAEGKTLSNLGVAYYLLGDARRAIPYYEQALTVARALDDWYGEGHALANLGRAYVELGETEQALTALEQAGAIYHRLSLQQGQADVLDNTGLAYVEQGRAREAIPCLRQALRLMRAVGNRRGEGSVLANLGQAFLDLGRTQRAIVVCTHARDLLREVGAQRQECAALRTLAGGYAARGEQARAWSAFEEALAQLQAIGDRTGEARCNWEFGLALHSWGACEHALPRLRAAVAYQHAIGHARADAHQALLARLEAGETTHALRPADQRAVHSDGYRP